MDERERERERDGGEGEEGWAGVHVAPRKG